MFSTFRNGLAVDEQKPMLDHEQAKSFLDVSLSKNQKIFKQANNMADLFSGELVSKTSFKTSRGLIGLKFMCQNGHNFFLSVDSITRFDLKEAKSCLQT